MNCGKAEIAGELYRRDRVREDSVEPVGDGGEHQRVETAPALIAREHRVIADVEAQPAGVDQELDERGNVANAKIEALTSYRMDHMRRLADECQPAADVAVREHYPEGIGPARSAQLNRAKKVAKAGCQFCREGDIRELNQPRGERFFFRPYDRGTVVAHRQDRKWARREEVLDRDAAMRLLVMHGRYDTGLAIAPLYRTDTRSPAHGRLLTIGRSHEPRLDRSSVAKGRDRRKSRSFDRADG